MLSTANGATPADAADSEYVKPEYVKPEYVKPDYVKSEYVNDNSTAYSSNRNSFSYPSNPTSSLAEPPQISPEITSTSQPNGIDRAPSRQGTAHWTSPTYPTSQQRTAVYNVVSDTRGSTNGAVPDPYGTPPSNASSYPPIKSSNKRGRDDDDEPSHTETQREPTYEYKRRKTISDPSANGVVGASVGLQSVTTGAVPRRR